MKRKHLMAIGLTLVLAVFLAGHISPAGGRARAGNDEPVFDKDGCTVIIVGKDASVDGSVMTTHTCDCGICDWTFRHIPAADHKPGSIRKIYHVSQYRT
jgi:hypothetical protein